MTSPCSPSFCLRTLEAATSGGVGAQAEAGHFLGRSFDSLSIENARRSVAEKLRQHGVEGAGLDARLLVGHALGLDHTALAAQAHRRLAPHEAETIAAFATRRLAHEPVARILERKEFWGLSFKLSPATFVPRPETETRRPETPGIRRVARRPAVPSAFDSRRARVGCESHIRPTRARETPPPSSRLSVWSSSCVAPPGAGLPLP